MKNLIFLSILLLLSTSTDVLVTDQCDCAKLLSQVDCKQKTGCTWGATTSLCSKASSDTGSTEGYCGLITDSASCAKTKGCAYVDTTCAIFAGCTAYKGATDAECQAISKQCNSDGVAYCVAPGACTTYKTEEECTGKGSSGGSGACVWDSNACREQKCSEGDATFTTDAQCNNFIKGCVTKGLGCSTSPLGLCSSYLGDVTTCVGLKGSDGYCQGADGKTTCQAKVCTDAETTLTTDIACAAFQIGCVTTGFGCAKSPLGACSTLLGDDVICANKKGSDGRCKGVASGKTCSVVSCTDAATSMSTDTECDAYKSGCVTTGKGCVASRSGCSSYTGTTTTCDGYIGSDGKCKGASDTDAACSAKVCTAADSAINTNAACSDYQNGCVTTGKGCISTLSTCSSYTGDATSCDGYIGTDGKCKGGATAGSCSPKVCSEAPATLSTNQDCADYQTGCIATGSGGCMTAGSCSTLVLQSQCDGKSTCQSTPQCNKNTVCADLATEILCKTVALQDKTTCWWVNSACVARACTQAPNTYTTDSLCGAFLTGCLTNGAGCLAPSAPCSSYTGTKTKCQGFTLKCTNADDVTSDACDDVTCVSNIAATSDAVCDSHHKGCLTTNPGCIAASAACTLYPGTTPDICGKFTGSSGTTPCWWTSGTMCVEKACTQAASTVVTDPECNQFLKGCVTNGAGCVANTTACSGYTGTQTTCAAFNEIVGSVTKGCSRREICTAQMACGDITTPTNQASCDAVLPGVCYFLKDKCMAFQAACTSYSHTATLTTEDCKNLVDTAGNKCWWTAGTACVGRLCTQYTTPTANFTCTDFLSTCAKNPTSGVCETVNCASMTTVPTSDTNCTDYHSTCHMKYVGSAYLCFASANCAAQAQLGGTNCPTAVTNQGGKCKVGAQPACVASLCTDVTVQGDCPTVKVEYAVDVYASTAQLCVWNTSCVVRTCALASTILGASNLTSYLSCKNFFEICALHYPAGTATCVTAITGTTAGTSGCQILQGTQDQCMQLYGRYYSASGAHTWKQCYKHATAGSTAACVDRACTQNTTGTTDAICQAFMPTCKTNGTSCIDATTVCSTTATSTVAGCATFSGITVGSKCQGTAATSTAACASRLCTDNGTATTDTDCDKFLKTCITTGKGCIAGTTPCAWQYGNQDGCKMLTGNAKKCWSTSTTTKGPCIDRTCSHNTTSTQDLECSGFLTGCVTDGSGCIEATAECTGYAGVAADCEKYTGNGKSCTNDSTASSTTACKVKDCTAFSKSDSIYSEAECQGYGKHCHYNGTKCDVVQTCSNLKGNIITCTQFIASDGPCKGTALLTSPAASCIQATCSDAPITLTTDAQCETYKAGCKTNGAGCGATVNCGDVQTENSCLAVVNASNSICAWASQCRDIASACSNFTTNGQSICINSATTSGFGVCVWKSSACTEAKCEDLPLSTSDESGCTLYSNTCTFAGQGCVTKGLCTSYNTSAQCTNAKSTDTIGSCSWDTTVVSTTSGAIVGCRAKNCTDAPITLTADSDCDAFISGCKTNGAGCITPPFACTAIKTQAKCLQDSSLQPCLWYSNTCQQYYKCEDLALKTVASCQAASKQCTTDDSKCVALKTCATYTKQTQCVIGTDGTCGWITSTKKCALYTVCSDLTSKVNSECQAFNTNCISNGTACIPVGECASYADSQVACKLGGTDGTCQFDTGSSSCRLRQCSDATTAMTTHNGCFGFAINATSKCTTDGTACVSLSGCTTYVKQAGCVLDDKLNACMWNTTAKTCDQKKCSDTKKTKSSDCNAALAGCVSDGTTCIEKAKCAIYTTKESCGAGGTDGTCTFTPASATAATTGTCKLFSQCSDASSDQNACNLKSATCKWTAASGTTASTCANHTCDTAAKGTAKCVTIPSFDGTKYTVCQVQGSKCVTGDPSALTSDTCYKLSQYTYSWSTAGKKCIACGSGATSSTNDTNTTTNNTANSTTPTNVTFGHYLSIFSLLFLIALMI